MALQWFLTLSHSQFNLSGTAYKRRGLLSSASVARSRQTARNSRFLGSRRAKKKSARAMREMPKISRFLSLSSQSQNFSYLGQFLSDFDKIKWGKILRWVQIWYQYWALKSFQYPNLGRNSEKRKFLVYFIRPSFDVTLLYKVNLIWTPS